MRKENSIFVKEAKKNPKFIEIVQYIRLKTALKIILKSKEIIFVTVVRYHLDKDTHFENVFHYYVQLITFFSTGSEKRRLFFLNRNGLIYWPLFREKNCSISSHRSPIQPIADFHLDDALSRILGMLNS